MRAISPFLSRWNPFRHSQPTRQLARLRKMVTRKRLLVTVVLGQMLLVVCGPLNFHPSPQGTLWGAAQRYYSFVSGADNGYGFFAPGVGTQFRTTFVIEDGRGNIQHDTLTSKKSQEANLRFSGIGSMISQLPEEDRDAWYHSLAASMFGKHPTAEAVRVRVEMYGFDRSESTADFPTMAEYRAGKRPDWIVMEEADFLR